MTRSRSYERRLADHVQVVELLNENGIALLERVT